MDTILKKLEANLNVFKYKECYLFNSLTTTTMSRKNNINVIIYIVIINEVGIYIKM
jgi:hypothetical protein